MANATILEEIVVGWKNYIFKNERIKNVAKHRMSICLDCEHLTEHHRCRLCSCYMPSKVCSPKSGCKVKKWLPIQ